ncbi:MAG: hypothetical protein ACLPUO_18895 [Streptosporangiaceae bacterium]
MHRADDDAPGTAARVPDLAAWEASLFARPPVDAASPEPAAQAGRAERIAPAEPSAGHAAPAPPRPERPPPPQEHPAPVPAPAPAEARFPGPAIPDLPAWLRQLDRPARGSPADLWLRLERLPPGHPSSPYHDDGSRKPPPPRLKHLELPRTSDDHDKDAARPARADSPARESAVAADPAATADPPAFSNGLTDHRETAGLSELSGELAGPAAAPSGSGLADRAAASSVNGGDRAAASSVNGGDRAAASSVTGLGDRAAAGRGDRAGELQLSGGRELPHRAPASSGHELPDRAAGAADNGLAEYSRIRAAASRAAHGIAPDSPGHSVTPGGDGRPGIAVSAISGRPAGRSPAATGTDAGRMTGPPHGPDEPRVAEDGSWRWRGARLTPEERHIADSVHAQYRAAEGQNVFGGYGRSGLTPAMRRIEAQLDHGQLAPDTERYALRDANVFRRQLASLVARYPGRPAEDLAYRIPDTIRYAYIFDTDRYTDGTWQVHRRLKTHGFELEERHNGWAGGDRQGIRSRWRDPAHNLPFEVQFHTPDSWETQLQGHASAIPAPRECAEITDYRREEPFG